LILGIEEAFASQPGDHLADFLTTGAVIPKKGRIQADKASSKKAGGDWLVDNGDELQKELFYCGKGRENLKIYGVSRRRNAFFRRKEFNIFFQNTLCSPEITRLACGGKQADHTQTPDGGWDSSTLFESRPRTPMIGKAAPSAMSAPPVMQLPAHQHHCSILAFVQMFASFLN
jgi:hypothetical protein